MQMKKLAKKRFCRPVALILVLLFLLAIPGANRMLWSDAAATGDPVPYLRIGLRYGNSTVQSADLLNDQGCGFDFGYFDGNRQFVSLAGTDAASISIMRDFTMHRNETKHQYESGVGGNIVVGCWHILLDTCVTLPDAQKLAAGYDDGFTALMQGDWCALAGSYTSEADAKAALRERGIDGTVVSGSTRCVTVVETNTGRILFEFDESSRSLAVMPRSTGGKSAVTWFSGKRYYGAFQFSRRDGLDLTVVNFVNMDDYIACVVRAEMVNVWPLEALKAQAVAARSYAAAYLNHHEAKYGFDLCWTTECQSYKGLEPDMDNCERAARETSGIYMTYQNEYVKAFYFACDGGATEDSENVFNEKLDYLRGKKDIYEGNVKTLWDHWTEHYTASEITALLNEGGHPCATIVGITPKYTALGNIASLTFTDINGRDWPISRHEAASILTGNGKHIYSQRFTITSEENPQSADFRVNYTGNRLDTASPVYAMGSNGERQVIDLDSGVTVITGTGIEQVNGMQSQGGEMIRGTRFCITGSGCGHNVGMSQYGAMAMASLGYTYQEILNYYYTGVTIG